MGVSLSWSDGTQTEPLPDAARQSVSVILGEDSSVMKVEY